MAQNKKPALSAAGVEAAPAGLQPHQRAYLEAVAAQNDVGLTEAMRIVLDDSAERYGVYDMLKESLRVPKGARVPRVVVDFSHHKGQR